jgi:hypothetical protein
MWRRLKRWLRLRREWKALERRARLVVVEGGRR